MQVLLKTKALMLLYLLQCYPLLSNTDENQTLEYKFMSLLQLAFIKGSNFKQLNSKKFKSEAQFN